MSSVGPLSIRDFDELKMSSEDKKATHISRSQVGPNPNSGITSVSPEARKVATADPA